MWSTLYQFASPTTPHLHIFPYSPIPQLTPAVWHQLANNYVHLLHFQPTCDGCIFEWAQQPDLNSWSSPKRSAQLTLKKSPTVSISFRPFLNGPTASRLRWDPSSSSLWRQQLSWGEGPGLWQPPPSGPENIRINCWGNCWIFLWNKIVLLILCGVFFHWWRFSKTHPHSGSLGSSTEGEVGGHTGASISADNGGSSMPSTPTAKFFGQKIMPHQNNPPVTLKSTLVRIFWIQDFVQRCWLF